MNNQDFTNNVSEEMPDVTPSNSQIANIGQPLTQQEAIDYDQMNNFDWTKYFNEENDITNQNYAGPLPDMNDQFAPMEQVLAKQLGQPQPGYVNPSQITQNKQAQQAQSGYTNDQDMTAKEPSGTSGYAPQQAQQEPNEVGNVQYQDVGPGYIYQNKILGDFEDPEIPLQVIDRAVGPFMEFIDIPLQIELSRQEELEAARLLREKRRRGLAVGKSHNSNKVEKNKRTANIAKQAKIALKAYKVLPQTPQAWGGINSETGEETFQYTSYGELIPGTTYTDEQMQLYLADHPQHSRYDVVDDDGEPYTFIDRKHSGLKLWIQHVPADSADRYPVKGVSSKCRFESCALASHTISKGEIRVCFDESRGGPGFPANPFHNAGYVHLFCLEKLIDFPDLCKNLQVLPDTREMPHETKKMAINRDHASCENIVNDFVRDSQPWYELYPNSGRPLDSEQWYEYSLCYKLTNEHLTRQGEGGVQKTREKRGGVHISVHKGNLDVYVDGRKKRKVDDLENPQPKRTRAKRVKRSASAVQKEESDDSDVLDEFILGGALSSPLSSLGSFNDEDISARPIKPARGARRSKA